MFRSRCLGEIPRQARLAWERMDIVAVPVSYVSLIESVYVG